MVATFNFNEKLMSNLYATHIHLNLHLVICDHVFFMIITNDEDSFLRSHNFNRQFSPTTSVMRHRVEYLHSEINFQEYTKAFK